MNRKLALGTVAAVLAAFGYVGYDLWTSYDCACGIPKRTPLTVYNPFRDRQPETVGEKFLVSLQRRDCLTLPVSIFVSKAAHDACLAKYPLGQWAYRYRENYKDKAILGYAVGWGSSAEPPYAFLSLHLARNGSVWQIESFDTFY